MKRRLILQQLTAGNKEECSEQFHSLKICPKELLLGLKG